MNEYKNREALKECLIVFTKASCPHCEVVKKRLDMLIPSFEDVPVVMIDSTVERDLVKEFDIRTVPTCVIVDKKGAIIRSESGAKPSSVYEGMLGSLSIKEVSASLRLLGF